MRFPTLRRLLRSAAVFCTAIFFTIPFCTAQTQKPQPPRSSYNQPYRPQYHFSPREKWMNDPNGLVYFNGTYHLFFQYYPGDIVWGPMHWGHATSKDLVHWKQQPIALYPDSLGYIFSGSVVVDSANSSGFGRNGKIPLVAIFTHHDPKGEKKGSSTFQNQSLAYSLDEGASWTKYAGNPVLKNPGITDFRDPSVSWHAKEKRWVMSLATKDRITFYTSTDLKRWTKESEFGAAPTLGGHGGVWECPNLFPLQEGGQTHWVLLVSNNPGGPNGGSGTQYFIGDWDGHRFSPKDTTTRWIDYGPDDYAGITFNNVSGPRVFLGWMSNWDYANKVPTTTWRNAMTIPRELSLQQAGGKLYLASQPSRQLAFLVAEKNSDHRTDDRVGLYRFEAEEIPLHSFTITFGNGKGQELIVGYDKTTNRYYIDRSSSGKKDFHPGFGAKYFAPRIGKGETISLTILIDAASIELFADDGLTVMTAVFFAEAPFGRIYSNTDGEERVTDLSSAIE